MKIICCTMYSPSHIKLADISIPNFQEYCIRNEYELHEIRIENDKWEYKKHDAFEKMMGMGCDLIFYKDVDSIITNMTIPIESFIDDKNDFFITKDFNEINGGSMILKNTKEGRWVNETILSGGRNYENEQNAINAFMKVPNFNQFVKVLPHPSINSYDYSLYPECKECVGREELGDWKEGNFVLHIPALGLDKRLEVLSQAKITR